jgi:hypothetical protein
VGRTESFGGPLIPSLGSFPVLDRCDILASELLVELMDSLDELRWYIGCGLCLAFGLGFDLFGFGRNLD